MILTWVDFLKLFSAEAWFFGQLPPLVAETAHYGVWETTLRELAENEKLTLEHFPDGSFTFFKKGETVNCPNVCEKEGKIFLCINLNGNTKADPFTECWCTTGIMYDTLFSAKEEMICAEDYIKGGGKETIPIVPTCPPGSTEVK